MRKRFVTPAPETVRPYGEGWLDIERAAVVEITSEEKDYSVESAFVSGETGAGAPQNLDRKQFDWFSTSRKS